MKLVTCLVLLLSLLGCAAIDDLARPSVDPVTGEPGPTGLEKINTVAGEIKGSFDTATGGVSAPYTAVGVALTGLFTTGLAGVAAWRQRRRKQLAEGKLEVTKTALKGLDDDGMSKSLEEQLEHKAHPDVIRKLAPILSE